MMRLLCVVAGNGIHTFVWKEGSWHGLEQGHLEAPGTCVLAHAGALIVGTRRGMVRSGDLGRTWSESGAGLTLPHVRWLACRGPGLPDVYAGTEPAGLFVSGDEGRTWHGCPEVERLRDRFGWSLPYSPEAGCVRGFAFHGSRGYAAVEVGGLLRSDDAGRSWRLPDGSTGQPKPSSPCSGFIHSDVHSVEVHPSSADRVFAPTGGGLFASRDGGATWECLYECYCRAVWLDPADPDHLILGPADGVAVGGRIEQTHDGGRTWRAATGGLDAPWSRQMVERFVRAGDQLLALVTGGRLLAAPVSTLSWRQILDRIEGIAAAAVLEAED
ncbi:MAG: sialidase family protein [bacterium]